MSESVSVEKQQSTDVAKARRALSIVNLDCGFHFYTAIGDYTGVSAVGLPRPCPKNALNQSWLCSVPF